VRIIFPEDGMRRHVQVVRRARRRAESRAGGLAVPEHLLLREEPLHPLHFLAHLGDVLVLHPDDQRSGRRLVRR
jgi:hypothetical protein